MTVANAIFALILAAPCAFAAVLATISIEDARLRLKQARAA
jgi:hypothetical protein